MSGLSVIVCTHNPRPDYLRQCVAGLQAQTLSRDEWDLILVDNASRPTDVPSADLTWHGRARVVREDKLGLTAARLRSIREATGDLLVFVDDDNVLEADYLVAALRVAREMPFLGSWSGQCRPIFDVPPPPWTRRYWGNLVVREFEKDVWSNLPRLPQSMPCGAGLCVRREVAAQYLRLHESGQRPVELDRRGDELTSGGDNDLAACACDLGLGVGLIAALRLTHLIPPERLTETYLARLAEGIVFAAVIVAHYHSSRQEIEAYRVRWHEPLRALLRSAPHRRIQIACLRGRRRGLRCVASLRRPPSIASADADRA